MNYATWSENINVTLSTFITMINTKSGHILTGQLIGRRLVLNSRFRNLLTVSTDEWQKTRRMTKWCIDLDL